MYQMEKYYPDYSFCLVISPRHDGLKVIAARLTDEGKKEIDRYVSKALVKGKDSDMPEKKDKQIQN